MLKLGLWNWPKLAKQMLDNWQEYIDDFIQVTPIEYKRVLHEEALRELDKKMKKVQQEEF